MAPQILTGIDDLNQVRALLGLDLFDFADDTAGGLLFVGAAELFIRKTVDSMSVSTHGAVPTVAQIMAVPPTAPATADDQLALRIATAIYVGYQFAPASAVAISTAVKVGPVMVNRGAAGTLWKDMRDIAFSEVGVYLSLITGWPDPVQDIFGVGGPTSAGVGPDTLSGFPLYGGY